MSSLTHTPSDESSDHQKLNHALTTFVKYFREGFVADLNERFEMIVGDEFKDGKGANICGHVDEVVKTSYSIALPFKGLSTVVATKKNEERGKALISATGYRQTTNESVERRNLNRHLTEAGIQIFSAFQCQFLRVAQHSDSAISIKLLAQDAVDRVVNYIIISRLVYNPETMIDDLTRGVVLGESKMKSKSVATRLVGNGYKISVMDEKGATKSWRTSSFFSTCGLQIENAHGTILFYSLNGEKKFKYGFRQMFKWEREMCPIIQNTEVIKLGERELEFTVIEHSVPHITINLEYGSAKLRKALVGCRFNVRVQCKPIFSHLQTTSPPHNFMTTICNKLFSYREDPAGIVIVFGEPFSGKNEIISQFLNDKQNQFYHVIVIQASTAGMIVGDLKSLGDGFVQSEKQDWRHSLTAAFHHYATPDTNAIFVFTNASRKIIQRIIALCKNQPFAEFLHIMFSTEDNSDDFEEYVFKMSDLELSFDSFKGFIRATFPDNKMFPDHISRAKTFLEEIFNKWKQLPGHLYILDQFINSVADEFKKGQDKNDDLKLFQVFQKQHKDLCTSEDALSIIQTTSLAGSENAGMKTITQFFLNLKLKSAKFALETEQILYLVALVLVPTPKSMMVGLGQIPGYPKDEIRHLTQNEWIVYDGQKHGFTIANENLQTSIRQKLLGEEGQYRFIHCLKIGFLQASWTLELLKNSKDLSERRAIYDWCESILREARELKLPPVQLNETLNIDLNEFKEQLSAFECAPKNNSFIKVILSE